MHKIIQVQEYTDIECENFIVHLIKVSDDDLGGGIYRQRGAIQGMLHRSLNRWCDYWYDLKNDSYRTQLRFHNWNNIETKIYERTKLEDDPEIKTLNHNSVWEFFKNIKYDYKNKKVSNTDKLIFIVKR